MTNNYISLRHIFLYFCLLTGIKAFAYDAKINGIYYNFSEDKATVTYQSNQYGSYISDYFGSVVIPASVTYNGKTYSVTSIGKQAFAYCSGLTSITIPNSVTSIGNHAFGACSGLTSVIIPGSVTRIGSWAFEGCSGLNSITIPNSITFIETGAFSGCIGLTSVTIPNSVTSIGNGVFSNCNGLTSVIIPNSVTRIGNEAFSNCIGLTSVTIPSSVTSIDNGAFRYCCSLTDVYCYAESVPNTHSWAFDANIINTTLHVPAASIKAYSTTGPWNDFGSIVPLTDEDAIESVTPDPSPVGEGSWYDILGRCTNKPAKGINILRMSDGTTKKVLRK